MRVLLKITSYGLALAILASCTYYIHFGSQFQVASAQSNDTSNSGSFEMAAQVPDWVKNNTAMWSDGRLGDPQFILGMRYLVANNIIGLPSEYLDSALQKPVPYWIKNVASWWTNGKISDYEFVSDIQYLVVNGDLMLGSDSQTTAQDSAILQDNFPKGRLKIDDITINVQIADTPDRMTEGLQFQQPLPYTQGMIFVFPQPQLVAMWMKDMQFPLDMIWFDSNGNVLHIERNLAPCMENAPCAIYDGGSQNTRYVLEVTAGFVDKFNVTSKSRMTLFDSP